LYLRDNLFRAAIDVIAAGIFTDIVGRIDYTLILLAGRVHTYDMVGVYIVFSYFDKFEHGQIPSQTDTCSNLFDLI